VATEPVLPQWAPRVKQAHIRRLYELDAQGICDEELIDEVGWSLLARCESFIEAVEATRGQVRCPGCGATVLRAKLPDEVLRCIGCGWELLWSEYFKTIQHKQLSGADPVLELFQGYIEQFRRATEPRRKMLLIDQLLHGFHWNGRFGATRAVAVNLIEGRYRDVLNFLDHLTYGEASTPGMDATLTEWRAQINAMADFWGAAWMRCGQTGDSA